jgi:hypothetical protein
MFAAAPLPLPIRVGSEIPFVLPCVNGALTYPGDRRSTFVGVILPFPWLVGKESAFVSTCVNGAPTLPGETRVVAEILPLPSPVGCGDAESWANPEQTPVTHAVVKTIQILVFIVFNG